MKKISFLLTLTLFVSLSAFVYKKDATFKVDKDASKITWKAKKVTGEHAGNISISTGTLLVANGKLKGGNIEIDTKTITVTDIADPTSNGRLLGHLKGDDFFAVEKHPTANLVILSATSTGDDAYSIKANVTIKGVTNEVTFPATVKVDKDKLTAKALLTLDRTKFDIRFRSKNYFENLGDKVIYDDFDLDINLVAALSTDASPKSKSK